MSETMVNLHLTFSQRPQETREKYYQITFHSREFKNFYRIRNYRKILPRKISVSQYIFLLQNVTLPNPCSPLNVGTKFGFLKGRTGSICLGLDWNKIQKIKKRHFLPAISIAFSKSMLVDLDQIFHLKMWKNAGNSSLRGVQ